MTHVSDIKLIRTDTTLDLSQKAEKGILCIDLHTPIYTLLILGSLLSSPYGTHKILNGSEWWRETQFFSTIAGEIITLLAVIKQTRERAVTRKKKKRGGRHSNRSNRDN